MRPFLTILFVLAMTTKSFGNNIKDPNVSGQFYPGDPEQLSSLIDGFFKHSNSEPWEHRVQILISPHAGYVYSGQVAALGYKAAQNPSIKTVVILAPSHYVPFRKAGVWASGGFRTPLGTVAVDEELANQLLAADEKFEARRDVFDQEHSLEVQIPFLQKTFSDFKIVPIIMGQLSQQDCQSLASSLNTILGDREDVLLLVSTDMSHFHTGAQAKTMDLATIDTIEDLDIDGFYGQCQSRKKEMCGFIPVTTALYVARERGLKAKVLKYATSGDVTGDQSRVVGYTSIVFYREGQKEKSPQDQEAAGQPHGAVPLTAPQKKNLLVLARRTIEDYVTTGQTKNTRETDPRLSEAEGAFVTIHKKGQLRGCIGHIVASAPLYETVQQMAIAAASSDPRFRPVQKGELPDLEVEISVLSKPRRAKNVEEITVGVHGVIVRRGAFHQGVFLPQVATETGWSREEFLSQLCSQKAGLPRDCWKDPQTQLDIFTADVFSEKDYH